MYPVATWTLHEITKLPICWLFAEYYPNSQGFIAFVCDGKEMRLYEGSLPDGLKRVDKVQLFWRRWDERSEMKHPDLFDSDKACGVEVVIMKDERPDATYRIGAVHINSEWSLERYQHGKNCEVYNNVDGHFVDIADYYIDITPQLVTIRERKTKTKA